jgi:predicted nucleotidyltransferase
MNIITTSITQRLSEIEKENDIKILYACESGSRAWNFHSVNSDWDVRFIYVKDLKYYLNPFKNQLPKEQSSTINIIEGDLDFSGWDLKKTIELMGKGNPPLAEWLNSPIVYKKDEEFYEKIKELQDEFFSSKSSIYHYVAMAKRNFVQYILNQEKPRRKKYLYVLRPILNCMWVRKYGSCPPLNIDLVLPLLKDENPNAYNASLELLEAKRNGNELEEDMRVEDLDLFLNLSIEFYSLYAQGLEPNKYQDLDKLDTLFIDMVTYRYR